MVCLKNVKIMDDMNGYQINEKDIATIIRLLKIHRPEEGQQRERHQNTQVIQA